MRSNIDERTIKELIKQRNNNNPNDFLIIENKNVSDFSNVNYKNIIFRNCHFSSPSKYSLFSNSAFENIIIENSVWADSCVENTIFKNLMIKKSIIYNNVSIKKCIFDNLVFEDSLMGTFGFSECEIKNTDFRGHEYFFLQATSQTFIENLYSSDNLFSISSIIPHNKEQFVIPWYNIKYTNCIIDLGSIKKLASYSDRLDSNFLELCPSAYRTGFINLKNTTSNVRYNLIANIFLYDAKQVYEYDGVFLDEEYNDYFKNTREKHRPPVFLGDEIDLTKYRKTLSTVSKNGAMIIVDDRGEEIDYSLIVPLEEITFISKIFSSNFVESHFDACKLNKKIKW